MMTFFVAPARESFLSDEILTNTLHWGKMAVGGVLVYGVLKNSMKIGMCAIALLLLFPSTQEFVVDGMTSLHSAYCPSSWSFFSGNNIMCQYSGMLINKLK